MRVHPDRVVHGGFPIRFPDSTIYAGAIETPEEFGNRIYLEVNFVLPHLGQYRSSAWAAHIEAIDLAKRYRNVYVDTSGIGSLKDLEMAVRELTAEKILIGTCPPEHDPRVEMEALRPRSRA